MEHKFEEPELDENHIIYIEVHLMLLDRYANPKINIKNYLKLQFSASEKYEQSMILKYIPVFHQFYLL